MKTLFSLLLLLGLGASAMAEIDPAHQKAINALMEKTHVREGFEKSVNNGFEQSLAGQVSQLPAKQAAKLQGALAEVRALVMEKVSWGNVAPLFSELYAKKFSKEEIEALLPLLDKPEMQDYLKKATSLAPDLMRVSQEMVMPLKPEIQSIIMRAMMSNGE